MDNIFYDLNIGQQNESEYNILNNTTIREQNILEIEVYNKNDSIKKNNINGGGDNHLTPYDNDNSINKRKLFVILAIIVAIIFIIIIILVVVNRNKDKDNENKTHKNTYLIDSSDTIKITEQIKELNTVKISEKKDLDTVKISEKIKDLDTVKTTTQPTEKIAVICSPGYYIPEDDLTLENCVKCSLEGCVKCQGTYDYNECISCGYLTNIYENEKIV